MMRKTTYLICGLLVLLLGSGAALAMSGSSILVTLNALRLRRAGQAPAGAGETRGGMPAGAPTGAEEMAR